MIHVIMVIPTIGMGSSMEYISIELARVFIRRGLHVTLIARGRESISIKKKVNGNYIDAYVVSHKIGRIIKKLEFLDFVPVILKAVIKAMMGGQRILFQAFFAYPPGTAVLVSRLLLFWKHIPALVTVAGDDVELVKEIRYGRRLDPILRLLIWFTLKLSDVVVVPSLYTKYCALDSGASDDHIVIIPFGYDFDHTLRVQKSCKMKPAQSRYICFLARLHPKKGLRYLIAAFKLIVSKYRDRKLIVIGKGEERKMAENLVKKLDLSEYVLFTGYINERTKASYLRNSTAYVLPSLSDSYPISVLEALANKCPVIITENVGEEYILRKVGYPSALIIKPKDIIGLADALLYVIKNEEKIKYHVINIVKSLSHLLSYHNIGDKYLKLYFSIIKCCDNNSKTT